jgi:hypothetical protein
MAFMVISWLVCMPTYALHVNTHRYIDGIIASESSTWWGFNLDNYIINSLLLDRGVNTIVGSHTIQEWVSEGGEKEDIPELPGFPYVSRSTRHFHDPITDNGFKSIYDSALIWVQRPTGGQSWGNYSWQDARLYYVQALLSSQESNRNKNISETFRGIGQIMHLVQDMSVPEHARDDFHLLDAYEQWLIEKRSVVFGAANAAIKYGGNLKKESSTFGASAPVPIANLFDTNKYKGDNPWVTIDNAIGLSEYTCANFLSPDTIFSPKYNFPSYVNVEPLYEDRNGKMFKYIKKLGAGEDITHFAVANRYFNDLPDNYKDLRLSINDEKVYEDYASKLLPRAIGYSSEVLSYFFRGTLEITRPDENVYSVIDGSQSQNFIKLKAKVKNITPDEEAGSGYLYAVAKYRVRGNYLPDLSNGAPLANDRLPGTQYAVSKAIFIDNAVNEIRLRSDLPNTYLFDFSESPIPASATDLVLMTVFKGTLGYEQDVAVAIGNIDILEPLHHVYFNLTDMYGIDNNLYTSGYIRTRPELMNRVGSAYIDPYPMTIKVAYVNDAPPNPIVSPETYVAMGYLQPGEHIRLVLLSDAPTYMKVTEIDSIEPGDDSRYLYYREVRNQDYYQDNVYTWISTPNQIQQFRTDSQGGAIYSNMHTGFLRCIPVVNGYCPYPENQTSVYLPTVIPIPALLQGGF